ncbi:hypothetical protein PTSG_03705 [Salpingoeca rosetta]|uniref:Uncharacterized protein n=1 Tax=Salpingoeca rosetta (strain ATCC 50818 / BSB-021) TaxID=946362 RepID=F2U6C6_SALR5|nr:uncharacterized protein PTSG_03705 [Salpingoeca rosetta]EGD83067.1 hypothetical protein PTSG_03705 [Salpingoeca rosetta]|eukprot:XP_004995431.1 hypothetical protein PTSG_03705 [Salpingoeca rosetta]
MAVLSWLVLFGCGYVTAAVLYLLHMEHSVLIIRPTISTNALFVAAGLTTLFIGLLFPAVDKFFNNKPRPQAWSLVLRSILALIGVAIAAVRFPSQRSHELNISLLIMASSMWWLVDGTAVGLGTAVAVTSFGITASQYLSYLGVLEWAQPDFFYVQATLIPILFLATMSFGLLGRQLARR